MSSPIDVAVNLLWCVPGRVGGSEEYLTRQLLGLARIDPSQREVAPRVFVTEAYRRAHPDAAGQERVVSPVPLETRPVRIAVEHTWLAVRSRGVDLVHHGGGTAPRLNAAPYVLTIHDLQYLTFPQYFSSVRLAYLRAAVPRSVRRARRIVVPTRFVATTVVEAFDVDPERITVVPHGFEPSAPAVAASPDGAPRAASTAGLERYGLAGRRYVVYPAITHPHKNHRILLEAVEHLDDEVVVVLLGGRGAADDSVSDLIDRHRLGHRIVRPGRVPDADRDLILASAEALVFPSRYEGFGAPLIEAMALGTPVVCSTHPALVEVGGDAVIAVDPDDAPGWAAAVDAVGRRRAEMIAAGRERVGRFGLEESGRALLDAYREAVA